MVRYKFEQKMGNLRTIFQQVHKCQLSLSPQKTELFMTKVIFTGKSVGKLGVQLDLAKTTAVINWGVPKDLQNLHASTCLVGYF